MVRQNSWKVVTMIGAPSTRSVDLVNSGDSSFASK